MRQKLLFFYLNTGGGHLSCAKSLTDYLKQNYASSAEVVLCNAFEDAPRLKRFLLEDNYRISQHSSGLVLKLVYNLNQHPAAWFLTEKLTSRIVTREVERKVLEERPDKIITTHSFLINPLERILKKHKLNIPVIAVVIDPFDSPIQWFTSKKTHLVIFSNQSRRVAHRMHIPRENLEMFPTYTLGQRFSKPLPLVEIAKLKKRFGLDPRKKVVLLLGGGDGLPDGLSAIMSMLDDRLDAELIMICGRNKLLEKEGKKLAASNPNLHIYGFVDYVYELLNISDVVITKSGASAIMEILLMGKIPIILTYLRDEETSHMQFVVKNNVGFYEPDPARLPALIKKIFSDKSIYNRFRHNLASLKLRNSTPDVARYILALGKK